MDREKKACPWFKQGFARKSESKEIRSDRQRVSTGNRTRICWCTHPGQSEFNENSIRRSKENLTCKGILKNCQLSKEQLMDV